MSNYYNMVKTVMLEKNIDFEEVLVNPNQESEYLAKSPMGKVPCIETGQGFLSETIVIFNYLEAIGGAPRLYPEDPFQRAKVEELIHHIEKDIELPARRLYGEVFFGRPATDELKAEVKGKLEQGFTAVARLTKFDPYVAGSDITYADFFFRFSVNLATIVAKKALDWDAFNELPNVRELLDLMDERESVQRALADQG